MGFLDFFYIFRFFLFSTYSEIYVDSLKINYFETDLKDTVLICLHGFGSYSYSFEKISEYLENDFQIFAYDRPGFGFSDRPEIVKNRNPYSYEFQIELLEKLIEKKGYKNKNIFLVGNSQGGYISLLYALKHKKDIKGVILINSSITSRDINPILRYFLKIPFVKSFTIRKIKDTFVDQGERILEKAFYDRSKLTKEILENYKKPTKIDGWEKSLYYMTISSKNILNKNDMRNIDIPVLIISSTNDSIIPQKVSFELKNYIKGSTIEIIDSCGHIPQEECPEQTAKIILQFLGR
ncbi:MAG: alpha/beta hydrolase [candidate division WOR-3 bacterium]